ETVATKKPAVKGRESGGSQQSSSDSSSDESSSSDQARSKAGRKATPSGLHETIQALCSNQKAHSVLVSKAADCGTQQFFLDTLWLVYWTESTVGRPPVLEEVSPFIDTTTSPSTRSGQGGVPMSNLEARKLATCEHKQHSRRKKIRDIAAPSAASAGTEDTLSRQPTRGVQDLAHALKVRYRS
ncbi:hypothetical protein THAOC_34471, partial [Thalassiosira oceanica]